MNQNTKADNAPALELEFIVRYYNINIGTEYTDTSFGDKRRREHPLHTPSLDGGKTGECRRRGSTIDYINPDVLRAKNTPRHKSWGGLGVGFGSWFKDHSTFASHGAVLKVCSVI